jgi:chromosome segregation ATPase
MQRVTIYPRNGGPAITIECDDRDEVEHLRAPITHPEPRAQSRLDEQLGAARRDLVAANIGIKELEACNDFQRETIAELRKRLEEAGATSLSKKCKQLESELAAHKLMDTGVERGLLERLSAAQEALEKERAHAAAWQGRYNSLSKGIADQGQEIVALKTALEEEKRAHKITHDSLNEWYKTALSRSDEITEIKKALRERVDEHDGLLKQLDAAQATIAAKRRELCQKDESLSRIVRISRAWRQRYLDLARKAAALGTERW